MDNQSLPVENTQDTIGRPPTPGSSEVLEFRKAVEEALVQEISSANKKQTVLGGGMIGVVFLGLFYVGQSQISRLDSVVAELSGVRAEISGIQAQVDRNNSLFTEIETLRGQIREHERSADAAMSKIGFLEHRVGVFEAAGGKQE